LTYWITYSTFLVNAGLLALVAGVGFVVFGLTFLVIWAIRDWRLSRMHNRRFNHRAFWLTMFLILSNFGAGALCGMAGIALVSRNVIDIVNDTGVPIDACVLALGSKSIPIGPMKTGSHRRQISGDIDGDVALDLQQGGLTKHVILDLYLRDGAHARVHIRPGFATDIETF
ncbi:MAG TPA: hypothetical protein VGN88_11620, partial [Phycisphaerae bacterium]